VENHFQFLVVFDCRISNALAATLDGALCSRGELPSELFAVDILLGKSVKIRTTKNAEAVLNNCEVSTLSPKLQENIQKIMSLEVLQIILQLILACIG
jgi:hypothetical protein